MPVGDVTLVEDNCRAYLIIDTDTLGVFGHHGDGGYHPVFSTFIDRRNYHHDLRRQVAFRNPDWQTKVQMTRASMLGVQYIAQTFVFAELGQCQVSTLSDVTGCGGKLAY